MLPVGQDRSQRGNERERLVEDEVMIRVRDLDAMAAQLRAAGIAIEVDPRPYPNGRFARLHDPEGNPIELWQPAGPGAPG